MSIIRLSDLWKILQDPPRREFRFLRILQHRLFCVRNSIAFCVYNGNLTKESFSDRSACFSMSRRTQIHTPTGQTHMSSPGEAFTWPLAAVAPPPCQKFFETKNFKNLKKCLKIAQEFSSQNSFFYQPCCMQCFEKHLYRHLLTPVRQIVICEFLNQSFSTKRMTWFLEQFLYILVDEIHLQSLIDLRLPFWRNAPFENTLLKTRQS